MAFKQQMPARAKGEYPKRNFFDFFLGIPSAKYLPAKSKPVNAAAY